MFPNFFTSTASRQNVLILTIPTMHGILHFVIDVLFIADHYWPASELTVVSLSFVEYLNRCSSPSICDFKFCSSGSFLRCLLSSLNSAKKLSRFRFSASTCFSSHRLALALRSLHSKNNNRKNIKSFNIYLTETLKLSSAHFKINCKLVIMIAGK